MSDLQVFSGQCCFCDIGRKTGETDMHGKELFTGDIVQLWHGNFIGTDLEEWMPSDGLTAVVAKQYQTYCNWKGEAYHLLEDGNAEPFTMGIRDAGVQGGDWRVSLVKSHRDLIEGERFPAFGFSFKRAVISSGHEQETDHG